MNKNSKRILSLLTVIVLAVALLVPMSAGAAAALTATAAYSKTSVAVGEEFTVTLNLTGVDAINGIGVANLALLIDPTKLEYVSSTFLAGYTENDFTIAFNTSTNKVNVAFLDSTGRLKPIVADCTFATVTLKALVAGSSDVVFSRTTFKNKNNSSISVTLTTPTTVAITATDVPSYTPVDLGLSWTGSAFNLSMTNTAAGYTYQIWTEETTADGTYWRLVKSYGASTGTESWTLDGVLGNNYKVYLRVKDSNQNIVQTLSKQFSAKEAGVFKLNSLTVDGVVATGFVTKNAPSTVVFKASATAATGNANAIVYDFYLNGALAQSSSSDIYNLVLSADVKPGSNDVKVVSYQEGTQTNNDSASAKIFVVNPTVTVPELTDNFNISASVPFNSIFNYQMSATGGNPVYRLSIGEPGRVAWYNSNTGSINSNWNYPGVYQFTGTVKDASGTSMSDGFVRSVRVTRANAVTIDRNNVTFQKSTDGTNYAPLADFNSAVKGNSIKITAASNPNVQYSFWKLDARGLRMVRDWLSSTDNTDLVKYNELVWSPAQAGNYSIQIRVRDVAFANANTSYEDAQTYNFNIGGSTQALSNVVITAPETAAKRTAVAVSASVTAADQANVMYRFEVRDDAMGIVTIQSYTMSNAATFVPRKAGTYTLRVLAKDANNFGYYDAIGEKVITVY